MMMERKNNSENNPAREPSPSAMPRSFDPHDDLEQASPTDSRADEKVIVNHRPGLDASFSTTENKRES